jgi:hypothetical protein
MKEIYVFLIAALLVFVSIRFLSKSSLIALGLIGMGALSLWSACYYYTKQTIPRRFEKSIEFSQDPKDHTSSISAMVVLGLFFVGMGLYGLVWG